MAAPMPQIAHLESSIQFKNEEEKQLFKSIIGRGGRLRTQGDKKDGEAFYVWRMLAFNISPHSQHHCMPVGADFYIRFPEIEDLNESCKARRKLIDELDDLVERIEDQVPKDQWYGLARWGRALGYLG